MNSIDRSQPVPKSIEFKSQAHKKYQGILETIIIGQLEATEAFARLIVSIKSGIRKSSGIIDSKFLAGPSGVGKTETVTALARMLDPTGKQPKFIKIDCGLLQHNSEMSKLIGSPPGYVGSKGTGGYIEPLLSPENIARNTIQYHDIQDKPKKLVIIVFDEFEKAHPDLQKLLLVSLDKGTIQTADNRNVDLSNCVILFTSNIGNHRVEQESQKVNRIGFGIKKETSLDCNIKNMREIILAEMKAAFPPEFRGRIEDTIVYRHLTREAGVKIARIKLDEITGFFSESGVFIKLSPSDQLVDYLAEKGCNLSEGARAIIKLINAEIFQNLVAAHTEFNLNGRTIVLDIDSNGNPAIYFCEQGEKRKTAEANIANVKPTTHTAYANPAPMSGMDDYWDRKGYHHTDNWKIGKDTLPLEIIPKKH